MSTTSWPEFSTSSTSVDAPSTISSTSNTPSDPSTHLETSSTRSTPPFVAHRRKKKLSSESDTTRLIDVGKLAVWTLSTAKHGNGVSQLRDGNFDTFWQSDGQQPHLITIQFHKLTHVQRLDLYLDYKLDESYTPQHIQIRSGSAVASNQMIKIQDVELEEPSGWVCTALDIKTLCLQIAIIANHQNGRDTHLRQVKVWGRRRDASSSDMTECFTSTKMQQFATIR